MSENLRTIIEEGWQHRDELDTSKIETLSPAIEETLARLDRGELRAAEPAADGWRVNEWVKMAIVLAFRLRKTGIIPGGPGNAGVWFDKFPMKFDGWGEDDFRTAGFRAVPGAIVRRSAYIAPGAVLMPCFINAGAYVGEGSMVDSWATVGSCAQIGSHVHISGGAGIGGVLEPLQARPVIVEDNCFIGARSEIAEGVIVKEGAVISMGVFLSASTKIVDRETGEVTTGRVPPYSVVVPGSLPGKPLADGSPGPGLAAAVIVKRVDAQTRAKVSVNAILRDL